MVELSDAEIYIMNIVWKNGQATSFDILKKVKEDKKLSKNTIRTLLARMVKKKAIYIHEKYGKTYLYKPLINRNEFLRVEKSNFLKNIYRGTLECMMLNFVEEEDLSKDEVDELLRKIEED